MDPLLELGLYLKAGHRQLERLMNDAMRALGVTAAQADALLVIEQAGPVSLKEVGELVIAEAGHPSRLVDRLVEAGLVERRGDADDRRRVELSLTPKGRRLAVRVRRVRDEMLGAFGQMLSGHDLGPVLDLLRTVTAATPIGEVVARRAAIEPARRAQDRPAQARSKRATSSR
jgi:DNA-binding MarR family transcriptional regulator